MVVPSSTPQVGTVAPVQVASVWKHPLVIFTAVAAAIPSILAALVELKELPGLPTNVLAWTGTAIAVLTFLATVLRQLGFMGTPSVTPMAAAKLIQTTPEETQ